MTFADPRTVGGGGGRFGGGSSSGAGGTFGGFGGLTIPPVMGGGIGGGINNNRSSSGSSSRSRGGGSIGDAASRESAVRGRSIRGQNIETGLFDDVASPLHYTPRLFGCPFQLLPSVDIPLGEISEENVNNPYMVGTEYMKNFLMHSPILMIRPGVPHYTGGDDPNSLMNMVKETSEDLFRKNSNTVGETIAGNIMRKTPFLFGKASLLQRRMYTVKPVYLDYMMYVNYMCRSVATFMGLTESSRVGLSDRYPKGAFVKTEEGGPESYVSFDEIRWQNYRLLNTTYVETTVEYFGQQMGVFFDKIKILGGAAVDTVTDLFKGDFSKALDIGGNLISNSEGHRTAAGVVGNKTQTVMFMVEPISTTETISNTTDRSIIESMIDTVTDGIGTEIAFITQSNTDIGLAGGIVKFLGSSVGSMSMSLSNLVQPISGGFIHNLFNGAVMALSGQKMIYPDIYKSSQTTMDHTYSVTLSTPYGDAYNYYMYIVVPLMHLIALAAPRMVTSNTIASPFLVQAFIPGLSTCQMGIVSDMTITKNNSTKDISVDGYPLSVKVTFKIKELYNSLSISPANDPVSFLFNETLNDYLANIAGIRPSIDLYSELRRNQFLNMKEFFGEEGLGSFLNPLADILEHMPFKRN